MQNIQYQCPNPITAAIRLSGNLFPVWQDTFCMAEVDDDVAAIDPLLATYNDQGEIEGVK